MGNKSKSDYYYVCPDHGVVVEMPLFINYEDVHNIFCIKCFDEFLRGHVNTMKKVMKEKDNG